MNRELLEYHRKAGKVKRWHTEFTIQTQTISDHVYNMIRIYYSIWGSPNVTNFEQLIYHDFEEKKIGDIPHFAAASIHFQQAKKNMEQEILEDFGLPHLEKTNPRILICDWIEALEFMADEVNMGNDTLRMGLEKLWNKLENYIGPKAEEYEKVYEYLNGSGLYHKYNLIIDGVHRG